MGLLNNDSYTTATGVQQTGVYIAFANETISVFKQNKPVSSSSTPNTYNVYANYNVYFNKSCKDNGMPSLERKYISTVLDETEVANNVYTTLYNVLKQTYTNTSDN